MIKMAQGLNGKWSWVCKAWIFPVWAGGVRFCEYMGKDLETGRTMSHLYGVIEI